MVLNSGKCHCLKINKDIANEFIELGKKNLHVEAEQKLLVMIIDKDLNFQNSTKLNIETANPNLSALISESRSLMTDFNKKLIFSSLVKPQFNYCVLLWMFSTRAANYKINKLHEKGLIALLNNETFNDMPSKSNDTTVHVNKNNKKLMIKFCNSLRLFGSHNERNFCKKNP